MKGEIKIEGQTTKQAFVIDMRKESWRYALEYALGWFFMPLLVIASRLFNKKIESRKEVITPKN